MKNIILVIILFLTIRVAGQQDEIQIVPQPLCVNLHAGHFKLSESSSIRIQSNIDLSFETEYLRQKLAKIFSEAEKNDSSTDRNHKIVLRCSEENDSENYKLNVKEDEIAISAHSRIGVFYGIQTLLQVINSSEIEQNEVKIPCLEIEDSPRFSYRGLMLDPARHFLPICDLKRYIDVMAMYKFNHLHLHLSDDQGWRVEIKKYPKLVKVGSYRLETEGDGKPHEGYYRQEELKDLVAYAGNRGITIIPEIDVPGHNLAAVASYPELTCFEGEYHCCPIKI